MNPVEPFESVRSPDPVEAVVLNCVPCSCIKTLKAVVA